jgi:hypothetical protein
MKKKIFVGQQSQSIYDFGANPKSKMGTNAEHRIT